MTFRLEAREERFQHGRSGVPLRSRKQTSRARWSLSAARVTTRRAFSLEPVSNRYLAIYLNDHLAGATGGLALARRAIADAPTPEYAAVLDRLANEIQEDRQALVDFMSLLGARPSRIKPMLGIVTERLGRLKLNGHVLRPSRLTPFVELEALSLGVEGKLELWRALRDVVDVDELVTRLDELIDRGEAQRAELERLRHRLVPWVFAA